MINNTDNKADDNNITGFINAIHYLGMAWLLRFIHQRRDAG
ncbi:MAG TPA: hypothetical protein PLA27_13740 [Anaerolineales bacterium]|jgi:hypothetical protein|nr:hypothetical protein [Anaerolineales bacterium]